jgi:REP element-mobilizing transposase RayT
MRSRYKVHDPDGVYFITNTIVEWIPVFTTRDAFDVITRSLAFCRKNKGMRLYAYVVLENHMHLIAGAPKLSETMQAFKSFTAREILRLAQASGRDWPVEPARFLQTVAQGRKRLPGVAGGLSSPADR